MADQTPKLALQTAVEDLGKYFNALEFSAFYDLLKEKKSFLGMRLGADSTLMPTDIAAQLSAFLFNATQGGMTVPEVLQQALDAGYKATVADGEQQTEVAAAANSEGDAIDANLFNRSLLFTYEDAGGGLPGLNAFSPTQGWSKNKEPDGTHIFSIRDVTGADVNKNLAAPPTKAAPALSVTQVFDPRLSISNHCSTAIQIFMNSIPTLELSRCVPFFNLQFISKMNQLDADGRPQTPTMFQFLNGSPRTVSGTPDRTIADARNVNVFSLGEAKDDDDITPATAGMELFTSPQTLVPGNEAYKSVTVANEQGALRSAPVLDRFRPLMSITKFNVDIAATQGMISYKTAKLAFILHDRSRLAEVAQLVKPDLYKATEFVIEYGWSHPDAAAGVGTATAAGINPFGAFLNALRSREKYGIKNSSFSFNDDGSVGIDVDLYMKGSMEINTTSIAKGKGVETAQVEIERLIEAIKSSQKNVNPSYAKDVQGFQILNSVTDTASVANIDKETLKKLKKFYSATKKSEELEEINESLKALWGDQVDGKGGVAKDLQKTIASAVAQKEKLLSLGDDPFLRSLDFKGPISTPDVSTKGSGRRKYVSLGKLLLIMCGAPLAETNRFDEVQFIFYPFNSKASYMHDYNLSQFPIHLETFTAKFAELKKITANLPIKEFMTFINKEFLSTQDTHAYGLVHTFAGGDNNRKRAKAFAKDTALADERKRILESAYGEAAEATFTMPSIKTVIESVPVNYKISSAPGEGSSVQRTLLRIHVMDAAASSYDGMSKMLQAARDSNLGYINAQAADVKGGDPNKKSMHARLFQATMLEAIKEDLLEPVPAFTDPDNPDAEFAQALSEKKLTLRVKGGFPALKNFVKRGVPTVVIGSQNSAIISAKLASMNSPEISSIMMLQGGPKSGDTAQGARNAGLPLQITPVQLGMDVFGCPLFQFGQQLFIDFGTGTNVDNIYTVYGISHSIGPGEYKTSLKFQTASSFGSYKSTAANIAEALQAISENQKPKEE